jgi:hypothetical protein
MLAFSLSAYREKPLTRHRSRVNLHVPCCTARDRPPTVRFHVASLAGSSEQALARRRFAIPLANSRQPGMVPSIDEIPPNRHP